MSVERSITRDVKVMSMGIDSVNKEIETLSVNSKLDKSQRKRLDRLQAVKVQLVDNPEDCNKLVKRYKEMA
jgi:hypothetical protein